MDLIRRKNLDLSGLKALVLDEADEMLRMGFIDDVDWIMEQCPATRQVALFSATMPDQIRRVAQKHLKQPKEIKIITKTSTAPTIRQRYWQVTGLHKLDAMTRLLEVEPYDALLAFVRTKTAAEELTSKLFHNQELARSVPQPTSEEAVMVMLKNRLMTAKLGWSTRMHNPHLRKWLHRIKVPSLIIWGDDVGMWNVSAYHRGMMGGSTPKASQVSITTWRGWPPRPEAEALEI